MFVGQSCCGCPLSRQAGAALIASALVLAGATLLASTMDSVFDGTLVMVVAAVLAGMLVNGRARVPGAPMIAAWITVPTIVVCSMLDSAGAVPVGSVFIAIMLAVVARSRAAATVTALILASAEVIARLI